VVDDAEDFVLVVRSATDVRKALQRRRQKLSKLMPDIINDEVNKQAPDAIKC
jgi:hypothetical protein